jgi:hypothetical protein
MPNLLLIESPGKLKKLGQILGSGWIIKASMGHVRELANDGVDSLGFDLQETPCLSLPAPRCPLQESAFGTAAGGQKSGSGLHRHRPGPGRGNHRLAPAAGAEPPQSSAGGVQRDYAPGGEGCDCPSLAPSIKTSSLPVALGIVSISWWATPAVVTLSGP